MPTNLSIKDVNFIAMLVRDTFTISSLHPIKTGGISVVGCLRSDFDRGYGNTEVRVG